jgi:L-aminopeptidase/D-esterase-like protein
MPEPVDGYQVSLLTVDIRGGAVGQTMGQDGLVDAVCFTGGSLHGLEAAAGVMAEFGEDRADTTSPGKIPVVAGACIYDFLAPGRKRGHPSQELGQQAYRAALASSGECPTGKVGAGRSATVGKMGYALGFEDIFSEPGGQGAAAGTFTLSNGKIFNMFVCTVVNSLGAILDDQGKVIRGHKDANGRHWTANELLERRPPPSVMPRVGGCNTTLTFVAMDFPCSDYYARQIARQIHTSLARVIDPFHTLDDGDVLYLVRMDLDWSAAPEAMWHEGAIKAGILGSSLAHAAANAGESD